MTQAQVTTAIVTFEYLFFALFGLHKAQDLKQEEHENTEWTLVMFKIVFAIYLLVTVIVLINLLIAMMSDTYQRIQQVSAPVCHIRKNDTI